jgi:hypothetical protein
MVSKRWTWLTAVAVLFAGLTNAHSHVHYCFDGQEPPASVHLVDGMDHEHELPGHHDDASEHDDLDLDVPNQALAKVVKYDLPAITLHVLAIAFEPSPPGALADTVDTPPAPHPRYTHPPTRAPPG